MAKEADRSETRFLQRGAVGLAGSRYVLVGTQYLSVGRRRTKEKERDQGQE